MRISTIFLSGLLSAALAMASVPTSAPATHACAVGKPTAASYTWDFKGEANVIFQEVEADARQVMNQADRLQSFEMDPNISRETQAILLNDMKQEINYIEAKLCRLGTIRRVLAPWQRKVVDEIASTAPLMVDNETDAIELCNHTPQELKFPIFWRYSKNLYDESRTLTRSAGDAVKFAGVSQEYRNLGHELGARGAS